MPRTNTLQLLAYAALSTSGMVVSLYARELGASLSFIGLIGAAHGVAAVASESIFGRLGDRVDRRGLLVAGFAAVAGAYLLQFYASDPTQYLGARFLVGFAAGIIPSTLAAYVYEIKRPLGKFTSFNAAGWLVGSLLVVGAGYVWTHVFRWDPLEGIREGLVAFGPYRLLFLLSALFVFVGYFYARRLPSMRIRIESHWFPAKVLRGNLHVYGPLFLRHLGATTIWVIFPLYVIDLGGTLALVGWLHVINMVVQILVFRHVDRLPSLAPPRRLIGIGLALSAVTLLGFSFARSPNHLLPLQVLIGASFASLWLGSLKEVLEHNVERATATGLLNASMSLSNVIGPLIGGFVASLYGYHSAIYLGAGIAGTGLVLFWLSTGRRPDAAIHGTTLSQGPAGQVGP